MPPKSYFAQKPRNKGRKRVAIIEPKGIGELAAYTSNLNTTQQELVHLHETCARTDMQEIQCNIKHGYIKAIPEAGDDPVVGLFDHHLLVLLSSFI
jgi:hypothetical protein